MSNRKITGMGKASDTNSCRGPATWKDMLRNALNDSVNWQTRKWSSCTKSQALVRTTISSKKEELRISWRIVRSLLTICLEMLVLGTNWTT